MEAAGATLVEIEDFDPETEDFWGRARDILNYEFKATINEYLAGAALSVETRSLDDLIAFNEANADVELALFDQSIFEDANSYGDLQEADYLAARDAVQEATRRYGIDRMLRDNDVTVLVSPSGVVAPRVDPVNGDVWPQWAGGGYLAAIAGYPHASVPMGTVHGLPVGVSFIGGANKDADVLAAAFAYEQATLHRVDPQYLESAEARPEIAEAMKRRDAK
jgi:amidase